MKFLLDTDHISSLQRKSGIEFLSRSWRIGGRSFADLRFSVVSFHEQVIGSHILINRAKVIDKVVQRYEMLDRAFRAFTIAPVLPFDSDAAESFQRLLSLRLRVATMDLRIAAIAISRNLVHFTRNVRDFGKVPGLLTENWTI